MNQKRESRNLPIPSRTINGTPIRNVKKEIGSDCNCSLSKTILIGEVLIDNSWHKTKWNLDGTNISGVERWRLNISNAADSETRNI